MPLELPFKNEKDRACSGSNLAGGLDTAGSAYADGPETVFKIQSGLVASDSLTSADGDISDWESNGSAVDLGAPRTGYEDSQGTYIDLPAAGSPIDLATVYSTG